MKPYSHERHELSRALGRACDHAQELSFFLRHKPEHFRKLAKDARDGKPLSPSDLERIGKHLKGLAADALHSIAEAHALASVFNAETINEEAA